MSRLIFINSSFLSVNFHVYDLWGSCEACRLPAISANAGIQTLWRRIPDEVQDARQGLAERILSCTRSFRADPPAPESLAAVHHDLRVANPLILSHGEAIFKKREIS
jgi:hypothetical protein